MSRIIQSMSQAYLQSSLDMVRRTFTDYENAEVIGYAMFSGFHLGGQFKDELLLSPVAVKELCENALEHISGVVAYTDYKNLT